MEQEIRILHLEDSAVDAELVERELRNARMTFTLKRVETRGDFIEVIDGFKPDLILLDYKLPAFDGLSALAIARDKYPGAPVIFISGVIGEDRAIETLKSGATDYVLKDKLARLVPAIERSLRESAEIRERKGAEAAVRDSAERFRAIVESAKDAIICLKPPGVIYLWNKRAEEMFGYPASDATGMDMHALIVPERYQEKARAGLTAFFQTGTGAVVGKAVEVYAVRKDGAEFPIELSISPMQIGKEWHATGIIRDITERKRAEGQLKQQVEELERFKKATIQREIRMRELKDRVEALEQGRDAPLGRLK